MNAFKRVVRIVGYILFGFGIIIASLIGFHDDTLEVLRYEYISNKINGSLKAVVVSDLHHRESLNFNGISLVNEIKKEKPDVVFLCGDLIDDWNVDLKNQTELLDGLSGTKTYYITGNHEHKSPSFKNFIDLIKSAKYKEYVSYIDDEIYQIVDKNIFVFGLHDKAFDFEYRTETYKTYLSIENQLEKFKSSINPTKFNVLLTHNPTRMNIYKKYGFDAIISGHTHGGQFRIGDWSPLSILHGDNAYNAGEYKIDNKDNQRLYVSKGLGYSAMFPIRVNCRPDILSINFHN